MPRDPRPTPPTEINDLEFIDTQVSVDFQAMLITMSSHVFVFSRDRIPFSLLTFQES